MLLRTLTILSFAAAVYAVPIAGTEGDYPVVDPSLSTPPSVSKATSDFPTAPAASQIPTTPDMAPVEAETVSPALQIPDVSPASDFPIVDLATSPNSESVPPPDDIAKVEKMLDDMLAKSGIPIEQPSVQSANLPEIAPPCDTTTDATGSLSNPGPSPIPVPSVQQAVDAADCNKCKTGVPPLPDFASAPPSPSSPPSSADLTSGTPFPTSVPSVPQGSDFPMFPDTDRAVQQGTGNGLCNTGADCAPGNCCSEFVEPPCPVHPTLSDVSSGSLPPLPSFSTPSSPPVLPATSSCPCANNAPVSNASDPSFPTSVPSTSPFNSANVAPVSLPTSLPSNDPFSFSSTPVNNPNDSLTTNSPSLDDLVENSPSGTGSSPSTLPAVTPNNTSADPADCDTTAPDQLMASTPPTDPAGSVPPAVGNLTDPSSTAPPAVNPVPPTTGNAMSSNYEKPAY